MKNLIRQVRLALTAAEHHASGRNVPEIYAEEIEAAQREISMRRGPEIIECLVAIRRAGFDLSIGLAAKPTESKVQPRKIISERMGRSRNSC